MWRGGLDVRGGYLRKGGIQTPLETMTVVICMVNIAEMSLFTVYLYIHIDRYRYIHII